MTINNNFKIINQKSKKYYDLLLNEITPKKEIKSEKDKERFGFYFFVLENITGKKDFPDILDILTDSDFNSKFFGNNFEDLGIDAINIDEDNNSIQLFNFKFRKSFTSGVSKIKEAINSFKFLNIIETEKLDGVKGRMKDELEKIIFKLKSKDVWNIQLFVISNEDFKFEKDENIKILESIYGLEVINIGLTEISNFISIRPEPINAEIILDKDAIMSFTEDSLSSSKSYIIRLSLAEIVRITCNNKDFRNEYNLEDYSKLSTQKLDFSVLFDNVRGFVTKSKYNNNITETLKNEPNKFFIYNNGLTFIVSGIETEFVSGNKKIKVKLENLQVVNGGQTLRSIHIFNSLDIKNIETNLSEAQILLRIFNVSSDNNSDNKIAEYTNSQNAISSIDLKSLGSSLNQLCITYFLYIIY
ncbi:MAG: AIPR family protein [Candidatus Gracilibacteria bacterium]|nr:AIPR family protein [Candidatus Gracilibacteria bacterium]